MLSVAALLFCLGVCQAWEVCYPPCGCFSDDPPFDDRDLPESPEDQDLQYLLFTRANPDTPISMDWDNVPLEFNPNKTTVFMSHGWNSGWTRMKGVMDAMLKETQMDVQVIQIEWSAGSSGIWYPGCASNARVSGSCAGYLSTRLEADHGLSWDNMHCIGHSLGAQNCGYMGKATGGRMGRISGLDPAGPWFDTEDTRVRMDSTDAQFMDNIHTGADGLIHLGLGYPIGDADFFPDLGYDQTPCSDLPSPGCDHNIAVNYYINSITRSECNFSARPCNSEADAINGLCETCVEGVDCQRMGYYSAQMPGRGSFFLRTAYDFPYCED